MFIDVSAIRNLIEKYNNLSISKGYMPVSLLGVITDLESLITDEEDHMEEMAKEFESREQSERDEAEAADNEMVEAGAAVMDWAQQEKLMDDETRKMQDWPGGV